MSTVARQTQQGPRAEEVFARLAGETAVLRRFGVTRLALFGSAVRGEAAPASDLDFLVDFERETFRDYFGFLFFLERLFGRQVDLVIRGTLKPAIREQVLREALDVPGL